MYTLTGKPLNQYTYYTYVLVNPITNKPFYVGKGKERRYLDHFKEALVEQTHNEYKTNTIKKILKANQSVIIDIVFTSNDEQLCFEQEVALIKEHGRKNNKTGILTNLTEGGEGGSYPHTEKHKQKLRENNPGGKATSKEIYQIDAVSGLVLKKWPSTRQAGISLGIKCWRNISHSANKHKQRVVGGFYWRWTNDRNILDNKLQNIKELNDHRLDLGKRSGKEVLQLSLDGTVIQTHKNMCEAARALNIHNSSISAAIKRKTSCAGYVWKLSQ